MKFIGQWLKKNRIAAGKTQLDVAYEAYISVDTVRRIEDGSIYPRLNHFEKLCEQIGMTPIDYYQACLDAKKESGENIAFPPKKDVLK